MSELIYELQQIWETSTKDWTEGPFPICDSTEWFFRPRYIVVRDETNYGEYYYQIFEYKSVYGSYRWSPFIDIPLFHLGWNFIDEKRKWMMIPKSYIIDCIITIKDKPLNMELMKDIDEIILYRWREWDKMPDPKKWKCIVGRFSKKHPKYDILIYSDKRRKWIQKTSYEMGGCQKLPYYFWMPLEKIEYKI